MSAKPVFNFLAAAIALLAVFWGQGDVSLAQQPQESLHDLIRFRIEAAGVPLNISVGNEPVHAVIVLPTFYERRVYRAAWVDDQGVLPQTNMLLSAIRKADMEALRPADYHLEKIESLIAQLEQVKKPFNSGSRPLLVDLELLLTDAFLIYGSHLLAGRTDPEQIDSQWLANRREADLAQVLEDALESEGIEASLADLLPANEGYARLRDKLDIYRRRAAAGDWTTIPAGSKLQKGDQGQRVLLLKQRLAAEDFITDAGGDDQALFDDDLERALQKYQMHNSLKVDGVLGPMTLQALNVSADQRARQIEVNMERWRWLPQNLGRRYILVNIAGFNLDVIESEAAVLGMRVIAGKPFRKTPVFSDKITYLVLNPSWGVPDLIARQDILPKLKRDPNYLLNERFRVFRGWGADSKELDPIAIDWTTISASNLRYRFKQEPGPRNALGRVKFMFPNKFDVYLHDTPAKGLFASAIRDFSSGCIRVEKPIELTEYLIGDHPDWSPGKIRAVLSGGDFATQTVKLIEPVNIHILYWTAWVGKEGGMYFSPDVYGRDAMLDAALKDPPPGS